MENKEQTPSRFHLLASACGLTATDMTEVWGVNDDEAEEIFEGSAQPTDEMMEDLSALSENISRVAKIGFERIIALDKNHSTPELVELSYATTNEEAQTIDWPFVGAQVACLNLIIREGVKHGLSFSVVPRGSTEVSRQAMKAHADGRRKAARADRDAK